jgi:CRISPR-associated protein Cas5d
VWGDFACFTRPEMKVERVSYDVITPSALRAIFEAILWKPPMRWVPERVEVLAPIRWVNIRRNELSGVVPTTSVKTAMKTGHGALGQFIEEERQQRAGLLLRDVRYRLHAHFKLDGSKLKPDETLAKYHEMFVRRADKGQCINQPYLGTREFACHFRRIADPATTPAQPIADTRDLGFMLYDLDYAHGCQPRLFRAQLQAGILDIPHYTANTIHG